MSLRIATAAYPLSILGSWSDYRSKLEDWVSRAAEKGARLLVFPEYAGMELATLDGLAVAGNLERSLHAVSGRLSICDDIHAELATAYGVYILAGSAPVFDPDISDRPVNRARLFSPKGGCGIQDKQIMTRFEREVWGVQSGGPLQIFETSIGKIGVLICYDAEFPLLAHTLADADVILVPSCTDSKAGYWRVRVGAMARALENQCVTVMSSVVGAADWSPAVDENFGRGGIFGPADKGFPSDAVMAEGPENVSGWTYSDIDLNAISEVRRDGAVLNCTHWDEQVPRAEGPHLVRLR